MKPKEGGRAVPSNDFVSIIIPVYKVEPYLRRCLDSALEQTYPNFEVIAVDDGSPDGCPAICNEYAAADPRVRVIHKENGGLSSARNAGLDIARGDWVYFMDSDDWCEPWIVEHCVEKAHESGAGMVVFDHYSVGHDNGDIIRTGLSEGAHTSYETLSALFHNELDFGAWHILYAKRLFDVARFPEGEICEDIAIQHLLIEAAQTVYVSHAIGYHYIARDDSITWTQNYHLKAWEAYQRAKMVAFARERYPELARSQEEWVALKVITFAKGVARYESLEELDRIRGFVRRTNTRPVGLTPRSVIGWHLLMASPRLFRPFTNAWGKFHMPHLWGDEDPELIKQGHGRVPF